MFEQDLYKVMTIYPGDVYDRDTISQQEKILAAIYKREGFVAPKISFEDRKNTNGLHLLTVKIDKGSFYRVKKVTIQGNKSIGSTVLKMKMKTWQASVLPGLASRFCEDYLVRDIKKLTDFYRSKKFPDAIITSEIMQNQETREVRITVTVSEGSKYSLAFKGNEHFSRYKLKKEVILFERGNNNNIGIRRSLSKIRERYGRAGFHKAEIHFETEEFTGRKGMEQKLITFVIDEGPQAIVEQISISGNSSFENGRIEKQMLTQTPSLLHKGAFVPEIFRDDLMAIRTFYRTHGYTKQIFFEEEVTYNQEGTTVGINIVIQEGVQTRIGQVTIHGMTVLNENEIIKRLSLKPELPFSESRVSNDKNTLSAAIARLGYPHVTVKPVLTFSKNNSIVDVEFHVNEGPAVLIGNIYYSGNFRTKDKTVDREFTVKTGQSFSLVDVLKGQSNIRNMAIFNSVKFKTLGLKEKNEVVTLLVDVEEKKPYFMQFGIGYESDKGIYVLGKAGDHNLLGRNKDGWIGGEYNELGYRGDISITEPRLFGTSIASNTSLYVEKESRYNQPFTTLNFGVSLGLSKKWWQKAVSGLTFRLERRQRIDDDSMQQQSPDCDPIIKNTPRSVFVTSPSLSYDSRDFFIRPRKGLFTALSIYISKGLDSTVDDFVKYRYDLRSYFAVLKDLTVATRVWFGLVDSYSTDNVIPQEDLFYLGGTSTIRGFELDGIYLEEQDGNKIGGKTAAFCSVEFRYEIGFNVETAFFFDAGAVTNSFNQINENGFRSSVGAGLRFLTPIGPIGILYGFNLDPKDDEPSGRYHFAIGYTF